MLCTLVWGNGLFAAPLIANWKLNETSTAQPIVESIGTPGIGNGTYLGSVVVGVPGPFPEFGTAAQFNGSNYATVGGGSVLNLTSNFTVSAWVNFDSLPAGEKRTYLGNNPGWAVRSIGTAPEITAFGVKDYDGTSGTLAPNLWTHVVTVLDASNDATFYVNGAFAIDAHGGCQRQ